MNSLNFGDIFWPVIAALLSSTIILEAVSFGLRYHQFKKQEKLYREMERKMASGEIPPEALGPMMSDFGSIKLPMNYPRDNNHPTTSGGYGNYL